MNSFDKAFICVIGMFSVTLISVCIVFTLHSQKMEQTKAQVEIVRMQYMCIDN